MDVSASAPHLRDNKLAVDQLRLALANLRPNWWLMPLFATIMCAMFSRWIAWPWLTAWWLCVVIGGAPLGWVCNRFFALTGYRVEDTRWIAHATIAYAFFAVCWSSMGFFLWLHGNDQDHMFIMIVLACTLAGNAALIGASRSITVVGFAVYGTTLVATPLQEGGLLYNGLALMALVYTGYLAHLSRNFYSTARDMLMLRDDKNDLIGALAASKGESDAARIRAEAASRSKSEFLANMSHELRTPLNAIIGFSEMIHSGAFANKNEEYSKLICDSGYHLLALINDILDLAKIEAGRMTLHEVDLDLHHVIDDCLALMTARAQAGWVTLSANVPASLPHIHGDERAVKQILLNLMSNAIKFTPEGGRVTIDAEVEPDGWLTVAICDTGMGIAQDDQARVFESFGQGRHDVASLDKGTGLGLPIVKGLMEAHGGRVTLDSTLGSGTCVTIYMPPERLIHALRVAS